MFKSETFTFYYIVFPRKTFGSSDRLSWRCFPLIRLLKSMVNIYKSRIRINKTCLKYKILEK